jgi:hypothetical protein
MNETSLKPSRRVGLSFENEEAVIADIERLRKGHVRAGNWTLAQVCDHLDRGTKSRMAPPPHDPTTPEQAARKAMVDQILATGELPDGIQAPDFMQPPTDCADEAIDRLIARLREFAQFKGPIAPHRLFGHLPDDAIRKLNRIHCARHLSFLTPTSK